MCYTLDFGREWTAIGWIIVGQPRKKSMTRQLRAHVIGFLLAGCDYDRFRSSLLCP